MLEVFVYGTLKPHEANYKAFCGEKVIEAVRAYTYGVLYDLPSFRYPAMTRGTEKVQGFLLTFAQEEALADLDRLEGYQQGRSPAENEYDRQKVPVYSLDGSFLTEAWTYFMSANRVKEKGGVLVPSNWWQGSS